MAVTDLKGQSMRVDMSLDSVTIRHAWGCKIGGASLDVEGFGLDVIKAGHVVIKNDDGTYKPMPVNASGDAYGNLPAGYSYDGVTTSTVLTSRAMVGVMYHGEVNTETSPYPVTNEIKVALNMIRFTKD